MLCRCRLSSPSFRCSLAWGHPICSPTRQEEIQHSSTVWLLLRQGWVYLGDAERFKNHNLSFCPRCQMGRRWCCSLSKLTGSWIEQVMAWEYFGGLFASSLTLFGVDILLWATFLQMKGRLVSLSFLEARNSPSGFTSMGQKNTAGTGAGVLLDFFSRTWHGCAKGGASEHCQPYWAVLAFFNQARYFLLQQLGSEMMPMKFAVHWYLLHISMGSCWKEDEKELAQMVKPHKKTDFPCSWQTAANWIFVLNGSRFSDFSNAGVSMYIFVNKSSVNICIFVFIS